MRTEKPNITDADSPDHANCEHCGQPISWDEICYTHDHSGFAECNTVVALGEEIAPGLSTAQLGTDPALPERNAKPTTWFEDAA